MTCVTKCPKRAPTRALDGPRGPSGTQDGRPTRQTSTSDQRGIPARQTGTADQHNEPTASDVLIQTLSVRLGGQSGASRSCPVRLASDRRVAEFSFWASLRLKRLRRRANTSQEERIELQDSFIMAQEGVKTAQGSHQITPKRLKRFHEAFKRAPESSRCARERPPNAAPKRHEDIPQSHFFLHISIAKG